MLLLFASSPSDTCHIAVEAAIRLILALVTSRIDYSNSLLAGVPRVQHVQRVQHAAALTAFELGSKRTCYAILTPTALATA